MKRLSLGFITALLGSGLFACSGKDSASTLTPTTPSVSTPTVTSIILEGTAPTIGTSSQFTATAKYTDNTTQSVTNVAVWTSSNALVATVSVSGVVSGIGSGNTNISVSYLGVLAIKLVTVSAP